MQYYNYDFVYLVFGTLAGVVGWSLITYFVMVWMSLTVWRRHIANPRLMARAAYMLVGLVFLSVIFSVGMIVTSANFFLRDRDFWQMLLNLGAAATGMVLLAASFIFFLLAIARHPSISGGEKNAGVPEKGPEIQAEPWDD